MTTTITTPMCSRPATISPTPARTRPILPGPTTLICTRPITLNTRRLVIGCQVALSSDSSIDESDPEVKTSLEKVGQKVRVKGPIKVYHVPKVPEFEITQDMIGTIKQFVGYWKGKKISPNFPFKVEFVVEVEGRGPVKFFAHLKDDEFDVVDNY